MNPIESDKLKRAALRDAFKALAPVLGVESISLTDKMLQMRHGDKIYFVGGINVISPKAIGEVVRDLILHGTCDNPFTVRMVKK